MTLYKSKKICTRCGSIGKPKTVTSGSFLIEIVLWCFMILPGILYTLWRLTTRRKACRSCGASDLVSVDSPIGRRIRVETKNLKYEE